MDNITKGIGNLSVTPKKRINPFADDYAPRKNISEIKDDSLEITQIFRNKENLDVIIKFLNNYKVGQENPIKGIILRGNIGSGKMTLIRACLKHTGYYNITFNADESDDIFENLLLSIETKGFHKLFLKTPAKQKKAIIIRDLDNALRSTQRSDFFKFLINSSNSLPVLMTSTDLSVGTEREVPKCILQLEFENHSLAELMKYFENPKLSKNALEKIILSGKFDIRYIKSTIESFITKPGGKININKIPDYGKDLELDTFNCIKYCSQKHIWDRKLTYSSLYTNSTIFHNYPELSNSTEMCSKIADMCCLSSEIIHYAFENQEWETLEESYNIIGTIGPVEYMTRNGIKMDNLVYPSSNITVTKESEIAWDTLQEESIEVQIIVSKYYKGNKFVGEPDQFRKEIKKINYPVQAYKLANMTTDPRKVATFLRDFRKRIKID